MENNRCTVAIVFLVLILFVWSASTMHWRYAGALVVLGAILFLCNLAYSWLMTTIPGTAEVTAARNAIWKRSVGPEYPKQQARRMLGVRTIEDKSENARWLIDHVDVALDRQIMKACGLIAFNALVMAVMAVEMTRLPAPIQWDDSLSDILRFGMLGVFGGLAVSSLICLTMFWVSWGTREVYSKFASEFTFNMKTLEQRTRAIALGVFVSGVSLVLAIAVIAMTELVLRPMPGA